MFLLDTKAHQIPSGSRRAKSKAASSRAQFLFQAEPEEDVATRSKTSSSSKRLFQAESGDSDSDESSQSDGVVQGGVLNFGWHTLYQASKSQFTRDVAASGKPSKKKRAYDNTRREARAVYVRKDRGSYQKNGKSTERISNLLSSEVCLCILVLYWLQPSRFDFIFDN